MRNLISLAVAVAIGSTSLALAGNPDTFPHRMGSGSHEAQVTLVGTQRLTAEALRGEWKVTEIAGSAINHKVAQRANPSLVFGKDGVSGLTGCNQFHARLSQRGAGGLTFEDVALTRKMCIPPFMETEAAFVKALNGSDRLVLAGPDVLQLYHGDQLMMQATRS